MASWEAFTCGLVIPELGSIGLICCSIGAVDGAKGQSEGIVSVKLG